MEKLGRETYLPLHRDFRTGRVEPLFPRYLFVRHHEQQQWWNLTVTYGVVGIIVRWCGEPELMADRTLQKIRNMENSSGICVLTLDHLRPGTRVKTVGGAMTGQLGIYRGMSRQDRCEVLYSMLGSQRVVSVPQEYLRAA